MKQCPYCGQELNKSDRQCSNCGNMIPKEKNKATSSSQSEQSNFCLLYTSDAADE